MIDKRVRGRLVRIAPDYRRNPAVVKFEIEVRADELGQRPEIGEWAWFGFWLDPMTDGKPEPDQEVLT